MIEAMSDKELIGYCDIHCESPRALFQRDHIKRMLELAGQEVPEDWESYPEFIASHSDSMKPLVEKARKALQAKEKPAANTLETWSLGDAYAAGYADGSARYPSREESINSLVHPAQQSLATAREEAIIPAPGLVEKCKQLRAIAHAAYHLLESSGEDAQTGEYDVDRKDMLALNGTINQFTVDEDIHDELRVFDRLLKSISEPRALKPTTEAGGGENEKR